MNQVEAQKELKKLKLQVEKLEAIINKPKDIFDIKTYSDVCKELGESEFDACDFGDINEEYIPKLLAFAKIKQIEKYFNQGWTPNWKNKNDYKYYPYFEFNISGGFGLAGVYCPDWYSFVEVGFYKSEAIADHVAANFLDIYKDLY